MASCAWFFGLGFLEIFRLFCKITMFVPPALHKLEKKQAVENCALICNSFRAILLTSKNAMRRFVIFKKLLAYSVSRYHATPCTVQQSKFKKP